MEVDSLISYVAALSGLVDVTVSDSVLVYRLDSLEHVQTTWYDDTTLVLQGRPQLGNEVAAQWLADRFRSFGYEKVDLSGPNDSPWRQNITAEKTGSERPEQIFILCAHYDAVPLAPGADDNASGTAAVLETARVLASIESRITLVFALWDAEEIGLIGSKDFAQRASADGLEIEAVVNLDMIAWDGDNDHVVEIHSNDESSLVANEVRSLVSVAVIYNPGARNSDHSSFWNEGYPAVMLIEELYGDDFNPNYHSEEDRLNYFNFEYFFEISKLAAAVAARYATGGSAVANEARAGPQRGESLGAVSNSPNPFSAQTEIKFTIEATGPVSIDVLDVTGRQIDQMGLTVWSPGVQTLRWKPAPGQSSGVLLYRIETASNVMTGRMVFVNRE